jgi:hypothetical protein
MLRFAQNDDVKLAAASAVAGSCGEANDKLFDFAQDGTFVLGLFILFIWNGSSRR